MTIDSRTPSLSELRLSATRGSVCNNDAVCYTHLRYSMKRSIPPPIAARRVIGAWVCLVAAALLWSPMWAAAWQSNGMDCCNGGMCQAHRHPNPDRSGPRQTAPAEAPMNCAHQSGSGITSCSMSCCREGSTSLVTAVIFVLSAPSSLSRPAGSFTSSVSAAPSESVQSFQPPSPPPKILVISL